MNKHIILIFVALFVTILAHALHARSAASELSYDIDLDFDAARSDSCKRTPFNNSDYMLLVLSNQVGFCRTKSDCNVNQVKNLFAQNIFFTIHGLWPQLDKEIGSHKWPQCCSGDLFREGELGALKNTMANVAWPQVTPFSLWEHEWLKHGTCALYASPRIPYIRNQFDYFNAAVNLFFQFNANERILSAGLRPSDNIPIQVSSLNRIFTSFLGITPRYTYSNGKGGVKIASEIWVCVSKSTQSFINCPSSLSVGNEAKVGDSLIIPTPALLGK